MIIEHCIETLFKDYSHMTKSITLERLVMGRNFTAVKLSDGSCGLSGSETNDKCCTNLHNRTKGNFSPGYISTNYVESILKHTEEPFIPPSVKMAIINALSSTIIQTEDYTIIEDCDPYDMLSIDKNDTFTMVGAFKSYIKKAVASGCKLNVLEINESALPDEFGYLYKPVSQTEVVIKMSNKIIITGSAIVNNTLPHILSHVSEGTTTAITGPTANLLPSILFDAGIDIIGGTRVTDIETMFRIISEGGSGYHLFGICASKICIVKK